MIINDIELSEKLLHSLENSQLVIFAGSGVSKGEPSNFPLFEGLVDKIKEKSGSELKRRENESPDSYLGRLHYQDVPVHKIAREIFLNPSSKPNSLHRNIIKIFEDKNSIKLVTTNFDPHFTTAIKDFYKKRIQPYYAPALPVALFFACCKHVGNGKYQPVNKRDIEEGGFGSYAVLYKRMDDLAVNIRSELKMKDVLPIGYQPFTRCYKQRGYFIDTMLSSNLINYDLVDDHSFKKFYFKRTPEFSKKIFNLFDEGKKLFHDQSMELLSNVIDDIKEANSFSEDSFNIVYDIFGGDRSKDWWQAKLSSYGIKIGETAFNLDDDLVAEIDDMWDINEFVDQEVLAIGGRRVYYPE